MDSRAIAARDFLASTERRLDRGPAGGETAAAEPALLDEHQYRAVAERQRNRGHRQSLGIR
jgi:hypothetical protein